MTGNPRPPPYLSQHARVTSVSLAQEAQETLLAVRKMLQIRGELGREGREGGEE